jgi:GT2 family glycosyltransferase
MKMNLPFVSVIIINFNSFEFTRDCIKSIIEQTKGPVDFEIVVVDNNSKASDKEKLDSLTIFPMVKLVKSPANNGFSGGNMAGVACASALTDYYFFLNNDCLLINDVPSILSAFMERTPDAGVSTAQMFNSRRQMQPSFGYFPSACTILLGSGFMGFINKDLYPNRKQLYNQPISVPLATGSALFVRASCFKEIGGFDTRYFLECEEEDLCMRFRKKGWKTYLEPQAKFIHIGWGSMQERNVSLDKEYVISYYYYLSKFHSPISRAILKAFYLIKIAKKVLRKRMSYEVFEFLLKGAPERESLRYKN